MQNEQGRNMDLYIPSWCSATNRLIAAKDHASVQISVGHLYESARCPVPYFCSLWFCARSGDVVPPTSSYEVTRDFCNEPFLLDITSSLDSELSTLHILDDFLAPSSWQDMMMKNDFLRAKLDSYAKHNSEFKNY
ncbi:40S ribosomal protein S21-2-like protein [Tanacetum coccineum]|uniref:40S ribosomal protein S21-2-like protein n=1 Tax=Tanacetum coccineum TaxID=301880 RepID=A0ABQ5FJW0_9ASTR